MLYRIKEIESKYRLPIGFLSTNGIFRYANLAKSEKLFTFTSLLGEGEDISLEYLIGSARREELKSFLKDRKEGGCTFVYYEDLSCKARDWLGVSNTPEQFRKGEKTNNDTSVVASLDSVICFHYEIKEKQDQLEENKKIVSSYCKYAEAKRAVEELGFDTSK